MDSLHIIKIAGRAVIQSLPVVWAGKLGGCGVNRGVAICRGCSSLCHSQCSPWDSLHPMHFSIVHDKLNEARHMHPAHTTMRLAFCQGRLNLVKLVKIGHCGEPKVKSDPDARQTSAQRKKIKAAENAARRMGGVIVSSSAGRGTKRGSDRRGKDKDDAESDEEQTVDDMDLMGSGDDDGGSEEDEVLRKETAAQKRLRLAKSYLAKVREDVD
eukprot:jgi/Hompol1/2993/HPOL_006283-RA